jgi:hypothetical protein
MLWEGSWTLTDTQLQSSTIRLSFIEPAVPIDPADWSTAVANVANAFAAASDAGMRRTAATSVTTTPTAAATDGAYSDIEDKALLVFKDGNARQHTIQLPAPEEAIFLTDEETVDKDDALIQAIITAIAALATLAAQAWTYYKGYRKRAPMRRGVAGAPLELT